MEVLETVEDVIKIFLARGAHGVVEANGLGREVDSNENPMNVVHVDGEEYIMQSKKGYFHGPLVHSVEFVGVGRRLAGEHISPNSKEFHVKQRSEAITVLAVGKKGAAAAQVPLNQQRSASMNARIVQPFLWSEATEIAHCHLRGQVARNFVVVRKVRGWGGQKTEQS
jgi:hypothetical protein